MSTEGIRNVHELCVECPLRVHGRFMNFGFVRCAGWQKVWWGGIGGFGVGHCFMTGNVMGAVSGLNGFYRVSMNLTATPMFVVDIGYEVEM